MKNYIQLQTVCKSQSKKKKKFLSSPSLRDDKSMQHPKDNLWLKAWHVLNWAHVPARSCLLSTANESVGQWGSTVFSTPLCFRGIIKERLVVISQPLTAFVPVCNAVKKKLVCDKASFSPRHMGAAGECHTSQGVTWNTVKLMSLTTGGWVRNKKTKTKTSHLIMLLEEKKKQGQSAAVYPAFFLCFCELWRTSVLVGCITGFWVPDITKAVEINIKTWSSAGE